MLAATPFADPWRFVPNVEVYLLVAFLIGAYTYLVRVIGPKAVGPGEEVISRRHLRCFVGAMLMLFAASTWPIHQIGEDYLYSAHMLQHMMLSYFLPPLVLLATPEWLLRVLVGEGATYRVVRFFTRPVVAAVLFNGMVMITHIPGVVNGSTVNGPFHFLLHFMVVFTAILAWMPVVGPLPELQMKHGAKMIYLFMFGVVPTVPAAWLAMAENPVYKHYGDQPVRVWNIDPINDQQVAGLIMKVGGGMFLWTVVIYMFFKRFGIEAPQENSYRRQPAPVTTLTYDDVSAAFDASKAPADHR